MPRSAEKATRAGRQPERAAARKSSLLGNEIGSAGLSPVIASRRSAVSSTERPIGPLTLSRRSIFEPGSLATRPGLGLSPTTPQKLAGLRRLPPRSDPCATQAVPVARETAAPPDEPAAESRVFQGFQRRTKYVVECITARAKFRCIGFRVDDAPLRLYRLHENVGLLRNVVSENSRTIRGADTCHIRQVLDWHRRPSGRGSRGAAASTGGFDRGHGRNRE